MISTFCLNHVMNEAFVTSTASFFVGLSSVSPLSDGTGASEPSGNGYSRAKVAAFQLAGDGIISNRDTISFPITTGQWFSSDKPAAYWCLFDGSGSGANLLASGSLSTPRTIDTDAIVTIPVGALSFSLTEYHG